MAVWYKGLPQGSCMAERQDVNYLMLYDAGDECTDVTGGWGSDGYRHISTMATLDVEKLSDSIKIRNTQNGQCRVFGTSNVINLSGYGEIGVIGSNSLPSVAAAAAYVSAKKTYIYDSGIVNSTIVSSNGIISRVDVRAVDKGYVSLICGYTGGELEIGVSVIFLAKVDDWQSWLVKAGLTVSDYGSLDAVIADHTALTTLMSGKAAVDYMLHHCTGTVMAAVIRSQAALEAIADSPYNTRIFKNEHWNKFLRMVGAVPESEKIYLYRHGDECMDVTGGWITSGYTFDVSTSMTSPPTKNPKDITFARTASSSGMTTIGTYNAIDLSGCTAIKVYGTNSRAGMSTTGLYITSSKVIVTGLIAQQTSNKGEAEGVILSIDISKITNVGYIAFNTGYVGALTFRIKKVWLER